MQAQVRLYFSQAGERFMGAGPERLLRLTAQTGSLRKASMAMGMSYSKAHALIKRLERALQRQVLECKVGGIAGGGAHLTEFGERWLDEYERLTREVQQYADRSFQDFCKLLEMDGGAALPADGTADDKIGKQS